MPPSNKLKILFIPRWYPNRVDPLNGIFIHRHAVAVATKHDVAVLYVNADPNLKEKAYDYTCDVEDRITIVRVYYNNSLAIPGISSLVKFFRYLWACRTGIKIINKKFSTPDISHIHVLSRTFLIAYYYKFFYSIPFLISEQWSGYHPEDGTYKGFLKKWLTQKAVKSAAAVTTVSESLKNAMLQHGLKNNYTVVPNVANTQLFFPSVDTEKKNKFIFLHVSNLDDRAKNVSGMIRAVQKTYQTRTDFEFHIVGEGEEKKTLEGIASHAGLLNKAIYFLGKQNSYQVAEKMRNADFFLLFSNYDNMPCVMVESLASGVPVIGSRMHGIDEHIKNERGILVPSQDEKALCDAMLKAMNSPSFFDKGKLSDYAKQNFSYDAAAEKFDIIYQSIKK